MLTYILLDLAILAVLGLVMTLWPQKLAWRPIGIVLAVLLVVTAVFDSIMIYEQIMVYESLKIIGLRIGKAPIEDFAYVLAAVVLIPYLWKHYARKD